MSDHESLPWKAVHRPGHYSGNDNLYEIQYGVCEECVCELVHGIENAEFMVRACNSHYEMLEALIFARDDYSNMYGNSMDSPMFEAVSKAIAKATGKEDK